MTTFRWLPRCTAPCVGPVALGAITLAIFLSGLITPHHVVAQDASPIITIGESNSPAQRADLLALFGVPDSAAVRTITVAQTLDAMREVDGAFDPTGIDSAYSSTMLICRPAGSGIAVTTQQIKRVPPALFALALLTAGVTDARLMVAAPVDAPALGMTALTGVFATIDLAPCASTAGDPARQQLALEELALIAAMGESRDDPADVTALTMLVLNAQQKIVAQHAAPADVDDLVQAAADGSEIAIGKDERTQISDVLKQVAAAAFDWGTFRTGWTASISHDNSVVLAPRTAIGNDTARGDGSAQVPRDLAAVGGQSTAPNAVASSPRVPAAIMTPLPRVTATPTEEARAVAAGGDDDLGSLFVTGTLINRTGDRLNLTVDGQIRSFVVSARAEIRRAGAEVPVTALERGDRVTLTIRRDLATTVQAVAAEPAPARGANDDGWVRFWPIVLFPLIGLLAMVPVVLLKRRRRRATIGSTPMVSLEEARGRARRRGAVVTMIGTILQRTTTRRLISRRRVIWFGHRLRRRMQSWS